MKFLLETASNTSATQWILPAVLLVLVIGIFVLNYFRSKKSKENMQNMVNSIKVGDKVKTYSGFYGKIIGITETTDGKVAVLETGDEDHHGYLSIDMNAIYAIDEKKPIVLDENGNIIDPNAPQQPVEGETEIKTEEPKTEEVVEEPKTENVVEEVKPVEEKPKKSTKKSTKNNSENKTKTTSKKSTKKENK